MLRMPSLYPTLPGAGKHKVWLAFCCSKTVSGVKRLKPRVGCSCAAIERADIASRAHPEYKRSAIDTGEWRRTLTPPIIAYIGVFFFFLVWGFNLFFVLGRQQSVSQAPPRNVKKKRVCTKKKTSQQYNSELTAAVQYCT